MSDRGQEQTREERPASRRGGAYRISVIHGPALGQRWVGDGLGALSGKGADCSVKSDDAAMSTQHAELRFEGGSPELVDLASKNGLFVNGARAHRATLEHGALVQLGQSVLRFEWITSVEESLQHGTPQLEIAQCGDLIGGSAVMRTLFQLIERVAPTEATVLLEGESGTGKELAARAIHALSPRHEAPFVVFDCSAVPAALIESELFGHMRGAFTGATGDRQGAFLRADGGTLLLDELGELPLSLQPRLLRALESGDVKAVGGDQTRRLDLRILAATNRDLEAEVAAGRFRADLFFRLETIRLKLPPLRERRVDIPALIEAFVAQFTQAGNAPLISPTTLKKLQSHHWPGNVRELRNHVERAILLATEERLETKYLIPSPRLDAALRAESEGRARPVVTLDEFSAPPSPLNSSSAPSNAPEESASGAEAESKARAAVAEFARSAIQIGGAYKDWKSILNEEFERRYWEQLLQESKENLSEAARRAQVHRKSAEYLCKKLGLR
ncbi:MAG: sigma 54-interacting transcriptional regulator [Myxococcota bacterium]|nr:sigma 54-interacting transcriptional regulator [Myxococcota bacterium]